MLPSAETANTGSVEVIGVEEGKAYNVNVTPIITASGAYTATLNGYTYKTGTMISNEGSHTLVVKLATGTEKRVTFKIDKTIPTYSWTGVAEKVNKIPTISIYNYEYESVQLFYMINDVPFSAVINQNERYYFEGIEEDGDYNLTFYTQDAAGNKSKKTSAYFKLDTKAPEIFVSGVEEGGVYREAIPQFSASDGTVTARLNYNTYISGTPITKHGDYTLIIEVKDSLNNRAEKKIQFSVDIEGPELNSYGWNEYVENSQEYSVTEPLKLKFSEVINMSTINDKSIQMKNLDTGKLEEIDFSKGFQELIDGYYGVTSVITIPFKEKLNASSNYRLTIDTTKIEDRVGNVMKSINNNSVVTLSITTRKFYDAPVIVQTNFDNTAINSSGNLKVYFAEDLVGDKVDSNQIYLTNMKTGLKEEININVNENALTIEPKMGLTENTQYQLTIQADAIRSRDNVSMKTTFIKQFKTADLFKVISGPESRTNEKRPKMIVQFSNPINPDYVSNHNFQLFENDNSNKNEEVELHVSLSADKKSVEVYPLTALQEDSSYKLVVNNNLVDIYGLKLVDKESLVFPIEVGDIVESIAKPSNPIWRATGFNSINLTFTDNSSGEEGYYIEIDGNPNNSDYIPSVNGKNSSITHTLIFDKPAGTHSIRIIPVIDEGDEDYENAATVKNIKLLTKKPAKPADIRVKLLKDGTLEWTWKDVPSDYNGATSYIIIRNSIKEKISSENRIRSSEGRLVEKLDISKEKVVNNEIYRYISRSVNVEGASGDDFESDKVLYKIKLPAKAPTAFAKTYEYDLSDGAFKFSWTMKDSKNSAKAYKYVIKRNKETVFTSDIYGITASKSTYSDTINYYNYQNQPGIIYQVYIVTMNSVGVETYSEAKTIKAVK
jgi:hypothetical protein